MLRILGEVWTLFLSHVELGLEPTAALAARGAPPKPLYAQVAAAYSGLCGMIFFLVGVALFTVDPGDKPHLF